jgi:hypothetical protein
MAAADRYHFPIELWTVGDLATNILPTEAELENMKNMINQAVQNPPFSMVFPPIIKYEALGVSGKLIPFGEDYEYIHDQILVGMGVNKNLICGDGPSFSNSKLMALQKLIMIYKTVRDEFESWMINKFYRPIAIENEFYYHVGKEKKLILPQISWYKSLDIEEEQAEKEQYISLHEKGYVSTKTLFSKFPNLDYDTEMKQLELEKGTIFDKGDRIPKEFIPVGKETEQIDVAKEEGPQVFGPGENTPEIENTNTEALAESEAKPALPEGQTPTTEAPVANVNKPKEEAPNLAAPQV